MNTNSTEANNREANIGDQLPYSVYFRHDDGTWTLYSREPSATDARDVAMMLSRLNYPAYIHDYIWKHKTPTYIDGIRRIFD